MGSPILRRVKGPSGREEWTGPRTEEFLVLTLEHLLTIKSRLLGKFSASGFRSYSVVGRL